MLNIFSLCSCTQSGDQFFYGAPYWHNMTSVCVKAWTKHLNTWTGLVTIASANFGSWVWYGMTTPPLLTGSVWRCCVTYSIGEHIWRKLQMGEDPCRWNWSWPTSAGKRDEEESESFVCCSVRLTSRHTDCTDRYMTFMTGSGQCRLHCVMKQHIYWKYTFESYGYYLTHCTSLH